MTPFIRSLSIQGFRNLADVQLTLKPLNVLAGGNGTGKSALLQFFEMLSFVSRPDKFREYVIRHGGGNAQCFMGGAVTPVITASVILTTEVGDYEYSLKLRYVPDDDQLVADESCWRFLPATAPVDKERSEKMLQQLGSRYGGFWESCPIFHFCRSAAEAAVNKRWDIGDSARLRSDGANLAPVLLALRENDLLRYRYIVRQIQRVFPDFGDFVLKDEYGRVLLHWKHRFSDQVIGPYLTSDGTLRFFFLVTLLNLPEDRWPPLLMIDEPETGLHPHAVELIAAMMRRVSYERQVLVATQSPALVDAVEPNDVIFTTVSRGAAQFARVPPAVWRRWQEGGCTLSDLWLSRPVGWGCGAELR